MNKALRIPPVAAAWANGGQHKWAIQLHLGYKNIQHTVRYAELNAAAVQGFLEGLIMLDIATDFHRWLLDQAAALRAQDYESLGWDHLAEESELMGARPEVRVENPSAASPEAQKSARPASSSSQLAEFHRGGPRTDRRHHNCWAIFRGKRDEVLADVYARA